METWVPLIITEVYDTDNYGLNRCEGNGMDH